MHVTQARFCVSVLVCDASVDVHRLCHPLQTSSSVSQRDRSTLQHLPVDVGGVDHYQYYHGNGHPAVPRPPDATRQKERVCARGVLGDLFQRYTWRHSGRVTGITASASGK